MNKITVIFSSFLFITYSAMHANSRNLHRDAWANYLDCAGRHDKAERWYQQVLTNGGSWYSFKGYISVLEKKKRYAEIVALITKEIEISTEAGKKEKKTLDKLFADDQETQRIFAQALAQEGRLAEAQNRFIQLSQKFKKNPEIMLNAIESYMQRQEPQLAINTIDTFLNNNPKKPTHFIFYFLKAQLLSQMNNLKEALVWAKKSIKPNPHFAQGWLLKAIIEEQLGLTTDAINSYHNFLKASGIYNSQILKHLIELEQEEKKHSNNKKPIIGKLQTFLTHHYSGYADQLEAYLRTIKSPQLAIFRHPHAANPHKQRKKLV